MKNKTVKRIPHLLIVDIVLITGRLPKTVKRRPHVPCLSPDIGGIDLVENREDEASMLDKLTKLLHAPPSSRVLDGLGQDGSHLITTLHAIVVDGGLDAGVLEKVLPVLGEFLSHIFSTEAQEHVPLQPLSLELKDPNATTCLGCFPTFRLSTGVKIREQQGDQDNRACITEPAHYPIIRQGLDILDFGALEELWYAEV
ncbi:hypothetical protein Ancab_020589 [Ancistrocladus abbreviatus]